MHENMKTVRYMEKIEQIIDDSLFKQKTTHEHEEDNLKISAAGVGTTPVK